MLEERDPRACREKESQGCHRQEASLALRNSFSKASVRALSMATSLEKGQLPEGPGLSRTVHTCTVTFLSSSNVS